MALIKTQITQEIADYLARHSRSDEVLERVARETAEMPRAEMATTPDEAALLTMLARLLGARQALEVGTFTGYGAISIARGLADGGRLTCLELEEKYAAIARRNLEDAGVADRVEIIVGPALESLSRRGQARLPRLLRGACPAPAAGRAPPDRQRAAPRSGHEPAGRA